SAGGRPRRAESREHHHPPPDRAVGAHQPVDVVVPVDRAADMAEMTTAATAGWVAVRISMGQWAPTITVAAAEQRKPTGEQPAQERPSDLGVGAVGNGTRDAGNVVAEAQRPFPPVEIRRAAGQTRFSAAYGLAASRPTGACIGTLVRDAAPTGG